MIQQDIVLTPERNMVLNNDGQIVTGNFVIGQFQSRFNTIKGTLLNNRSFGNSANTINRKNNLGSVKEAKTSIINDVISPIIGAGYIQPNYNLFLTEIRTNGYSYQVDAIDNSGQQISYTFKVE